MVLELPKDFRDFLLLLNTRNIRYLVVGGWAVALHGKPRYTKDIDILISRDKANASNLMAVLDEFGFGEVGVSENDFMKPGYVIQLGIAPHRIDILTGINVIDFDVAEKRKTIFNISGVPVNVIAVRDLITAKNAAGRLQDLADVEQLEKISKITSVKTK